MIEIDKILEKQRTWQEASADDESLMSAMALESLSKCADAITILSGNLRKIGYVWVSSEPIPVNEVEGSIRIIEAQTGLSIPKILVAFWKMIGGISFVDLEHYRHVGFWHKHKITAPQGFADGLHVDACSRGWAAYICEEYDDWQNDDQQDEAEPFLMSLSPDGYHKDNISGGEPYGVFTGSAWKPIWQYFEWSGGVKPVTALADPPDFLSYVRTTVLECAGFPGLLGIPAFDRLRDELLEDVPLF
ncbi:MAG TPA: hypothetical protein VFR47_09340 [Anaerolineales bacterium]|nr:hypothetical protein [Anaerolineales bacterium]